MASATLTPGAALWLPKMALNSAKNMTGRPIDSTANAGLRSRPTMRARLS